MEMPCVAVQSVCARYTPLHTNLVNEALQTPSNAHWLNTNRTTPDSYGGSTAEQWMPLAESQAARQRCSSQILCGCARQDSLEILGPSDVVSGVEMGRCDWFGGTRKLCSAGDVRLLCLAKPHKDATTFH